MYSNHLSLPCRAIISIIGLCICLLLPGCDKPRPEGANTDRIVRNLRVAYGKALQHRYMYEAFMIRAQNEPNKALARLYKVLAESEAIRAAIHARDLTAHGVQPDPFSPQEITVGNMEQTLKMALSCEDLQGYGMYPAMISLATSENDSTALTEFTLAKQNDARHYELCFDALNRPASAPKISYAVCPGCGYVMTGVLPSECPLCRQSLNM